MHAFAARGRINRADTTVRFPRVCVCGNGFNYLYRLPSLRETRRDEFNFKKVFRRYRKKSIKKLEFRVLNFVFCPRHRDCNRKASRDPPTDSQTNVVVVMRVYRRNIILLYL